jgi:hypothetical protein
LKKPRGKQPTKPDVKKALITRNLELKGVDNASLTIPIIYRRTFDWHQPDVTFIPINHRSFVVFRGGLEKEEYEREKYTKVVLDITDLPQYCHNRERICDYTLLVELKEALLAASLKDRYVRIQIPRPKSKKLYSYLKEDMENIVGELGWEYSTDHKGINVIFKFPKHDIKYYAMESKTCLENAISSLGYFRSVVSEKKFEGAISGIDDLLYDMNRLELLMDRYFSNSLNLVWDLPNTYCPGYYFWINACEKIMDEYMYITRETNYSIKSVKQKDIPFVSGDKDLFGFVWDKAIENSMDFCESALRTMELEPDEECIQAAFSHINDYEEHRKKIGFDQNRFIKLFAGDSKYLKDSARAERLLTASFHLNNIFQSSDRIIDFTSSIAKNTLRIGMK